MDENTMLGIYSLSPAFVEGIVSEVASRLTQQLSKREVAELLQTVFLDVEETAALLRVKPKTISTWISQNKIPARYAGGRPIFLLSELLHWTLPKNDKHAAYRLSVAISSNMARNRPTANRERSNPDGSL